MGLIINTPDPAQEGASGGDNNSIVIPVANADDKLKQPINNQHVNNEPPKDPPKESAVEGAIPPVEGIKLPANPDNLNKDTIVEIEGVEYKLDTDGNAVKDGKIIYTKDQLEDDEESLISIIQENTGLVIKGDDGQPLVFTDDAEGLIAREKAVINMVKRQTEKQVLENFYNANPEIESILNYKKLHGSIKDYNFKTNYSAVKFIDGNVDNHKQLVTEELRYKGLTDEDIDMTINALIASNKLGDRAKNSESFLKTIEGQEREKVKKELERRQELQRQTIEKEYGVTINANKEIIPLNISGSIYDLIVAKGKIGEYVIPETGVTVTQNGVQKVLTRLDIFNYVALAKENGLSQAQIDDMKYNENIENRLIRYLSNILRSNITSNKVIKKVKATSSTNYSGKAMGTKRLKLNYNV